MVSIEGVMHTRYERARRLFPSIEGWQIRSIPNTAGAGYIVSQTLPGHQESVYVFVRFTGGESLEDSERPERDCCCSPPGITKTRLVLMVPDGAR